MFMMVTVTEVGPNFVKLSSGQTFYLWEKIRSLIGALPNDWGVFEDWCERVNALERLAVETEDA